MGWRVPLRSCGDCGTGTTVSLPGVLSGAGAASNKLGNDAREAAEAPAGLCGSAALPPRRRRGANALLPRR